MEMENVTVTGAGVGTGTGFALYYQYCVQHQLKQKESNLEDKKICAKTTQINDSNYSDK